MKKLFAYLACLLSLIFFTACQQDPQSPPQLGTDLNGLETELFNQPIKENLSLKISYQKDPRSQTVVKDFSCQRGSQCQVYFFLKQVDFSPPADVCTQIYGGPEVVTLTGEVDGRDFSQQFKRTNGCQIERFESLSPLLDYAGF